MEKSTPSESGLPKSQFSVKPRIKLCVSLAALTLAESSLPVPSKFFSSHCANTDIGKVSGSGEPEKVTPN